MHSERCDCKVRILIRLLLCAFMITGCASAGTGTAAEQVTADQAAAEQEAAAQAVKVPEAYSYQEYPLERNGISLHLDCIKVENTEPENNILLVHGSTYSSHEFDIDYEPLGETLAFIESRELNRDKKNISEYPLVKAILNEFNGAKIDTIIRKSVEAAEDEEPTEFTSEGTITENYED